MSSAGYMFGLQGCSSKNSDIDTQSQLQPHDTRELFLGLGTCSRTFFYILNREFDHHMSIEERAADPLAGGILRKGYQCGMIWGSSLATGAEAYRRYPDYKKAMVSSVKATEHLLDSFKKSAGTINCKDITDCDLTGTFGSLKCYLFGGFDNCRDLAEKWAPDAIQAANQGLQARHDDVKQPVLSCATEVAKRLGFSEREMIMVAGFAGGLGLSGNGCGALCAAIWLNTLAWCKKPLYPCDEVTGNSPFENSNAVITLSRFLQATDSECQGKFILNCLLRLHCTF